MVFDFIDTNDIAGLKQALSITPPTFVDQFGYSALHIALSKGFDEIAEILIEAGIDLNLKDPKGQTALHYCAFYNKPEIARLILQQGGRLDIEDNYGNQPLWTAVFNDYGRGERIEIVDIFINSGAQKEHKNNANRSPKDLVMSRPCENLFSLFGIESKHSPKILTWLYAKISAGYKLALVAIIGKLRWFDGIKCIRG